MKQRRATIHRVIARASIFLLLGAMVNIAMAWGCGFSRVQRTDPTSPTEGDDLRWWRANAPPGFEWSEDTQLYDSLGGFGRELAQWPEVPLATVSGCIVQRNRCGWPLLTMERSVWYDGREVHRHAWKLAFFDDKQERNLVPLKPLWSGFAINTLFYAAILWLLFTLPRALRRWRRIKRGLCPTCAYPVGASDLCTECGKPVNPRPRKASSGEPAPSS